MRSKNSSSYNRSGKVRYKPRRHLDTDFICYSLKEGRQSAVDKRGSRYIWYRPIRMQLISTCFFIGDRPLAHVVPSNVTFHGTWMPNPVIRHWSPLALYADLAKRISVSCSFSLDFVAILEGTENRHFALPTSAWKPNSASQLFSQRDYAPFMLCIYLLTCDSLRNVFLTVHMHISNGSLLGT